MINLDQPSKTIAKHVYGRQNFHTSQIPGPSTINVPYIPPTHKPYATGSSIRNELYIAISHSDYNADNRNDISSQVNYVPQSDESIMVNYASNPKNILPRDAQNNIENMCSQHNLSVQTYSSFQQNSSAHREFQKDFLQNDFGHVCHICDNLWFKKDLKIIVNKDTTPNIQFIKKWSKTLI